MKWLLFVTIIDVLLLIITFFSENWREFIIAIFELLSLLALYAGIACLVFAACIAFLKGTWKLFERKIERLSRKEAAQAKNEKKEQEQESELECRYHGKSFEEMTGLEFEHFSAQWLVRQGFHSVTVTPPSRDFGADITAKDKDEHLWVFQCKLYSSKLGNKPIQEVVASKAHYGADHAGVITNSTFTKAAERLAQENGVKLYRFEK